MALLEWYSEQDNSNMEELVAALEHLGRTDAVQVLEDSLSGPFCLMLRGLRPLSKVVDV